MSSFEIDFSKDFEYFNSLRPHLIECNALKMFLSIFHKELFKSCEFSFRDASKGSFELAAEANDIYFFNRVIHFLEFIGIEKNSIIKLQNVIEKLDDGDSIIKVGFSENGVSSVSVYFRTPCSGSFIEDISKGSLNDDILDDYAKKFNATEFFIGIDFMPFRFIPYAIFKRGHDKIVEAFSIFAKKNSDSIFKENLSLLNNSATGDIFVSFLPSEGKIKADFMGIPAVLAMKIIKDLNLPLNGFKTAVEFLCKIDKKSFYYFSISSLNGIISTKFYFKRFYQSADDSALIFADELEKIKFLR